MGTVQLLPWGHEVVDMDAIFVNLTLAVDEKGPSGGAGTCLEKLEDLLDLNGRGSKKVNRVLLKGFAGSGKTTAMAKIAYDWSKNVLCEKSQQSILSQYKLLFILNLREVEAHETLIDAIFDQILPQDTAISKKDLEALIQSHSKETLILLDGLDEFPMERLQKKVTGDMESLLANRKMRDTCIVVTTRPEKVEDLGEHHKHYTQVKLSGFSEDNIEVYIKKFFQENQKAAKGLIKVLHHSPSIKVLAQIPVMLLMLCLLWSDSQKLPDTYTGLYEQVILYLWKRYRNSDDVSEKDEDVEEVLLSLGKKALDGLTSDGKLVFSEKDFPEKILQEACKAGLLTKERLRSKLNVSNSISFLHKSIQEYFAAYYWVTLAEKDDDSFQSYLQHIADDDQVFAQVELLTFCCGMSEKAAALVLPHVVQVLKHRTDESLRIGGITQKAQKDIWPLFRMLKESGLKYEVVHSWFEPLFQSKVVEIRQNPPLSLAYFHYLVRIVAKSKSSSVLSQVRELKLFCGSGSIGLIVETLDEMTQVESLVLSWETEITETRPSETQVVELSARVKKLTNLKDISVLARNKLDISRIVASLSKGSNDASVRKIELGNVDFDTETMGLALKRQTSLKSLLLTNVSLTPQGASQMLSQIRSSLQVFHVVSSTIGEAVGHLKPVMPSLEEITMTNAKLQENHVEVLIDFLPRAGKLKHIDLSWNTIGSKMVKMAHNLQYCPLVHTLTLLNTNLNQKGVVALANSFQYMPRLENVVVSLGTNGGTPCLTDNGFEILEAMFKSVQYLPKLSILDLQRLPVPEGATGSPFFTTCMEAVKFDLEALQTRREKEGFIRFGFALRPLRADRLPALRAAITRYNKEQEAAK